MLTDPECRCATTGGKALRNRSDDRGLQLWICADGRTYWRLRYWVAGKERSLDLTQIQHVPLHPGLTLA
jgi:hypothetical protein